MDKMRKLLRLAGVTYHDAQENIKVLSAKGSGTSLTLLREPDNLHDTNAIRVEFDHHFLGYVPRRDAAMLAALMDRGASLTAKVAKINASPAHELVGLMVEIFSDEALPVRQEETRITARRPEKKHIPDPDWFKEAIALIRKKTSNP